MKFRLLEAAPNISKDSIDMWKRGTDKQRGDYTDSIIRLYDKPSLKNIRSAIYQNFDYFGIDRSKNPFMDLLDELEFEPTTDQVENFNKLSELQQAHEVDLSHDYLREESLYDRTVPDFTYTVYAFETVLDPQELSKYFDDTTGISADQFRGDDGKILPAGKPGDNDLDTIYGVIEQWGIKENGESNAPSESTDFKYTLNDVFKHFKVPNMQKASVAQLWVKTYFASAKSITRPKKDDYNYYYNEVGKILSQDKIKLTQKAKNDIIKGHSYGTPEDIPEKEKVEGNIVYLREREHQSYGNISIGDPEYCVYSNGEWISFDTYARDVKEDKKSILLTTKLVNVVNNKAEAAAGIIRGIDLIDSQESKNNDALSYI